MVSLAYLQSILGLFASQQMASYGTRSLAIMCCAHDSSLATLLLHAHHCNYYTIGQSALPARRNEHDAKHHVSVGERIHSPSPGDSIVHSRSITWMVGHTVYQSNRSTNGQQYATNHRCLCHCNYYTHCSRGTPGWVWRTRRAYTPIKKMMRFSCNDGWIDC